MYKLEQNGGGGDGLTGKTYFKIFHFISFLFFFYYSNSRIFITINFYFTIRGRASIITKANSNPTYTQRDSFIENGKDEHFYLYL